MVYGGNADIADCQFFDNQYGIVIYDRGRCSVQSSQFRQCKSAVKVELGGTVSVTGSTMTENGMGVEVEGSATVKGCRITANDTGIWVRGRGSFEDNDLSGNKYSEFRVNTIMRDDVREVRNRGNIVWE